ncbi:MAG: SDR family NAD(P)-dependent oxidoreductase [Bacteroidota bacterium]
MSTVLITGGAKRLGKHFAIEFAKKNWNVAFTYNSSVKEAEQTKDEISKFNKNIFCVKCDIRNKGEIESAFESVTKNIGCPDVLINNAGVFPPQKKFEEITEEFWDEVFAVNLKGALFASQIFALNAPSGSRIVNIASLGGIEIWKQRTAYNVSKSALIKLTKAMSRELAPKIAINCVCPGFIEMPEDGKGNAKAIPIEKIPMARYGTAGDVFDAVYFFATASQYITGQTLIVDGGYHNVR